MKNYSLLLALSLLLATGTARAAQPDVVPTPGQQAMIDRKYGMFLHFGMNTYLNVEWSDGSAAASVYAPPADIAEKAAGWVRNAKRAGMRSIVLTTKHHDGFCLWDSQYTDYDVANPQVRHKADIVRAVSDACKKEGIAFSIYYSLWDRHEPLYKDPDPRKYIEFMSEQNPLAVKRIKELAALLGIQNGGAFPKNPKKPSSLTRNATATATGVRNNDMLHHGALYAVDSDVSTAWTGDSLSVLNVRLEKPVSFKQIFLIIGKGSIREYALEYLDGDIWKTIRQDQIDPATQPQSFMGYGFIDLKLDRKIRARDLRLRVLQSNGQPSVYSLRLR